MKQLQNLIIVILLSFPICSLGQVMGEFEGDIQSNTLSGNGDRNVVADPSGVLKIGNLVAASGLPLGPVKGEMVYFDGTNWVTVPPGTDGQTLTMCNCVPTWGPCPIVNVNIGDTYAGGIVFYLDGNGGGLVAQPTDTGMEEWGCMFTNIPGADATAIGTGAQNTLEIVAGCLTPDIAADICVDLVSGGYSDWFLPSIDELAAMYFGIGQGAQGPNNNLGGFQNTLYWSSSENGSGAARVIHFGNGNGSVSTSSTNKNNPYVVRAIRAF